MTYPTSRRLSPRELVAFERFVLGDVKTAALFGVRDPATLAALEAKLADARAADIIGREAAARVAPVFCGKQVSA